MITRKAKIRDLEPGPVNALIKRLCRLARDAATVRARAVVNAIDFRGNAVAEAMADGNKGIDEAATIEMGKLLQKCKQGNC